MWHFRPFLFQGFIQLGLDGRNGLIVGGQTFDDIAEGLLDPEGFELGLRDGILLPFLLFFLVYDKGSIVDVPLTSGLLEILPTQVYKMR